MIIPHCIENEFSECVASVLSQTHRELEHVVLRDLPHATADDTVFRTFMERAAEFDLFMKLDADMVIEDERFLSRVAQAFVDRPWMDLLAIPVRDFFTDRLIPSVNIYRSFVRFPLKHDGLMTDPLPVCAGSVVDSLEGLDGVVSHCRNPSPFQAFHYGLHRGMKVVRGDPQADWDRVVLHAVNHDLVWRNFLRRGDRRLGMAVLGGELALAGAFDLEHISYQDPRAREVFAQYEDWDAAELLREIRRLRRAHWGWLPWWVRLGMLNRRKVPAWRRILQRGTGRCLRLVRHGVLRRNRDGSRPAEQGIRTVQSEQSE